MATPSGLARALTVDVHAHRGGAGLAPENTLAAFRNAIALGADVLELDLHVSRDGELIVIHDPTVSRTTDGRGYVREMTVAELKRLDAGARFDPRFAGERIPTLGEVLALVTTSAPPHVRLNIETKYPSPGQYPPPPPDFETKILHQVRAAGLRHRVIVQSFHYPSILTVKAIDPTVRTAALRAPRDPASDPVAVVREARADLWAPQAGQVTVDVVEALHRAGVPVVPWTVNAPAEMERLLEAGIGRLPGDGIITDYPDRLLQVLRARGIRASTSTRCSACWPGPARPGMRR
ncbi:MAG: glycerophosphodiester phosphodiesterase family protein [Armatimonadota bacterium]|nr:glycerophosphodiester phosphodiesterase family protein [Armatimonadota bacterium]MDR7533521.1 glycerophosphodiester phosphodiesterase family protein [Armatimonadota bacterium]MDR7536889.1 glycerophosphodiester phosphodiesterase family protein [Armatimonadota bacterium]